MYEFHTYNIHVAYYENSNAETLQQGRPVSSLFFFCPTIVIVILCISWRALESHFWMFLTHVQQLIPRHMSRFFARGGADFFHALKHIFTALSRNFCKSKNRSNFILTNFKFQKMMNFCQYWANYVSLINEKNDFPTFSKFDIDWIS